MTSRPNLIAVLANGFGAVATLVFSVAATNRLGGAAGFGVLSLALIAGRGFGALAQAGAGQLVLGLVAHRTIDENNPASTPPLALGSYLALAVFGAVSIGAVAATIAAVVAPYIEGPQVRTALVLAAIGLPAAALLEVLGQVLLAFGRPAPSIAVRSILPPAIATVALYVAGVGTDQAARAVLVFVVATALAALVAAMLLHQQVAPRSVAWTAPDPLRSLAKAGLPFALSAAAIAGGQSIVLVVLSFVSTADEVGRFAAAWRVALPISLVLAGVTQGSVHRLGVALAANDTGEVQRIGRFSARLATALAAPLAVFLLAWPGVVEFVFGDDFGDLDGTVRLLVAGYLFAVLLGPVGQVLTIAGEGPALRNASLFAAVVGAVVTAALGSEYGAAGAAAGQAVLLVVLFGGSAVMLWRQRGLAVHIGTPVG